VATQLVASRVVLSCTVRVSELSDRTTLRLTTFIATAVRAFNAAHCPARFHVAAAYTVQACDFHVRYVPPKRRFLQESHGVTSQETPFFL
jgi:hypothetical protein